MEGFVLERMRDEVLGELAYVLGRGKGYVVGCGEGWEGVKEKKQVGAVLWTGKGGGSGGRGEEEDEEFDEEGIGQDQKFEDVEGAGKGAEDTWNQGSPPPYAMATYKDSYIPIYNLGMLLGAKHAQRLREEHPIFKSEVLVIKDKRPTMSLQMKLWKLMGFLA